MAAKYRKIDPRIWHDEKFHQLSPTDKLVAIYLLTAQCNRIGLFTFSLALCAEDTGLPPETCRDNVKRVCNALDWQYDEMARVLWLPKWWKYHGVDLPDQNLLAWLEDLHDLPESELTDRFLDDSEWLEESPREILQKSEEIRGEMRRRGLAGAQKRWGKKKRNGTGANGTMAPVLKNHGTQESGVRSKESGERGAQPPGPKASRSKFSPPSPDEVAAYVTELGGKIDPDAFVDYYAARGWKLGRGVMMKDWRAAVRSWESREKNDKPKAEVLPVKGRRPR